MLTTMWILGSWRACRVNMSVYVNRNTNKSEVTLLESKNSALFGHFRPWDCRRRERDRQWRAHLYHEARLCCEGARVVGVEIRLRSRKRAMKKWCKFSLAIFPGWNCRIIGGVGSLNLLVMMCMKLPVFWKEKSFPRMKMLDSLTADALRRKLTFLEGKMVEIVGKEN